VFEPARSAAMESAERQILRLPPIKSHKVEFLPDLKTRIIFLSGFARRALNEKNENRGLQKKNKPSGILLISAAPGQLPCATGAVIFRRFTFFYKLFISKLCSRDKDALVWC
jgi:hypothetical protein